MDVNNKERIFEKIKNCFPDSVIGKNYGIDSLTIPPCYWKELCTMLRKDDECNFNMLVCISAVDMGKDGLELFVHLRSVSCNGDLIVKCTITEELPEIDSLCELWQSAELYEDEVYDLFGIRFLGHPFLRRIFLEEDFKGYPLRKSYGKILEH